MRIFILFFLVIYFNNNVHSQYSLTGVVHNDDQEHLELVAIFIPKLNLTVASDKNGFYKFENLPSGQYEVQCFFLGYDQISQTINIPQENKLDFHLKGSIFNLPEIEIASNQNKLVKFPGNNIIGKKEFQKENMGQDVPILLQWLPSVITTSDAGAGIGYTSMRIRGVDQARINVTINDIPLNDAESQNVFWVDLPDLASSTENVKIQRGVGPSTNGAGAYGGTVALNTFGMTLKPTAEASFNYGSFNTQKMSVKLNSGLMNNQYNIEARYSQINSDGYIDRATSRLQSYYLELSKVNVKSSYRFLVFSGKERTYQAWNGVPKALVENDKVALSKHYNNNVGSIYKSINDSINLFNSDRRYNLYEYQNQVDDYVQTHVQFHAAQNISSNMTFKTGLHYTRGLGFFEQFRYDDKIKNYGIPYIVIKKDTFNRADIVRRRWLDNHFYGLVSKIEYKLNSKNLLSLGGGYNQYAGGHYGQLLFVNNISINPINEYYNNQGDKNDANIYLRQEGSLGDRIGYSADIQYRDISYKISGIDNDLRTIDQEKKYSFLNPKFAFNYHINANNLLLASFAVANREPDRSDLLDNPKNTTPSSEKLLDYELGYRLGSKKSALDINLYFMNYRDQLVLTGELNDVGNAIRTNVPKSHRLGLEVSYLFKPSDKFNWQFNTTISRNKISKFTEVLYDYTNGFDIINNDYTNTNIAFSPSLVVANSLGYNPSESLSLSLNSKYIGRQFLDNTSNVSRSLNPFTYSNLLIQAQTGIKSFKQVKFTLQINNLFNSLFSNNGYTYSYIYGDVITENFLFPQAGINLIGGISVKL